MSHITARESMRLGKLAKANDLYQKRIKQLPRVGDGWGGRVTYRSLREAKRRAKGALGSFHVAVIPAPDGRGYEVWVSEVTTMDERKAPKGASYLSRYLDFTLKKIKPHDFFKRVR